jgi:hypothetical protein
MAIAHYGHPRQSSAQQWPRCACLRLASPDKFKMPIHINEQL